MCYIIFSHANHDNSSTRITLQINVVGIYLSSGKTGKMVSLLEADKIKFFSHRKLINNYLM